MQTSARASRRTPWRASVLGALVLGATVGGGLSGCAVLLVGAGAAGGYAVSRDAIKNHLDLPLTHVYRVSREVVREAGFVTVEDERRGLLKATVGEATVTITIKPVSQKTVELKVKARRFLLPNLEVAQAIYNKILDRLP